MQLVAGDCETYLIGPNAVVPKLVCTSFATNGEVKVYSTADMQLEGLVSELFTPGNGKMLLFHNAAFDVPVVYRAFPHLQTKIWDKVEAGEITCTLIREMLLNLATHGKLDMFTDPGGNTKQLRYALDALVKDYLGIDISEGKSEDSYRTKFDLLDGLPAAKYPKAAYDYVADDADHLFGIWDGQNDRANAAPHSDVVHRSLETAPFHTAAAIALMFITERGMATEEAAFNALRASVENDLSDANMRPLIDAMVMTPAQPPKPYKQDIKKAKAILAEWLDVDEDEVDLDEVDDDLLVALEGTGDVRVKAATKSKITQKQLKRYVVAALIAKQTHTPIDELLEANKDFDEMLEHATKADVSLPLTDTKQVSAAGDVIDGLVDQHPVLQTYQKRQALQKIVSTEIPRMMWDGKLSPVVHFPYKALLETGRTSSGATDKYPSANGQNVDPRARGVYVPREGYTLVSCDFSALELVCVAQTTFDLFGHSVHRDEIIKGKDLHAFLGTRLVTEMAPDLLGPRSDSDIDEAYNYFKTILQRDNVKAYKFWRKLAKPTGLGFASGLGAMTMVELAMKDPYNIDMLGLAEERYQSHPEEFIRAKVDFYAKKLYGWDKGDERWTPMLKACAFAQRLRAIWLKTYPEMVEYFKWVVEQKDASGAAYFHKAEKREAYFAHLAEWEQEGGWETGEGPPTPEDYGGTEYLCYTTPMGMHRARSTYTAVANGRALQSPGAEGAKSAVIKTVRACLDPASTYLLGGGGGFVVNFIHDELLVEVKNDEFMHERTLEIQGLMEDGLRTVISDVPVATEAVAMQRWDKFADPTFDDDGRLLITAV